MTWHVLRLRKLLSTYHAREWQLQVDGEELSDHFLLLEAMNIHSIGPVLNLAPKARTGDGSFDLVLACESERDRLVDYLRARLEGKKSQLSLYRLAVSGGCRFVGRGCHFTSTTSSGRKKMRKYRRVRSKSRLCNRRLSFLDPNDDYGRSHKCRVNLSEAKRSRSCNAADKVGEAKPSIPWKSA